MNGPRAGANVDEIVTATNVTLSAAVEAVARVDACIELIALARENIERARATFHLRLNTTAAITATQAATSTFSICVTGVTCGTLRVGRSGTAEFRVGSEVNEQFAQEAGALRGWIPWADAKVRAYIDRCEAIANRVFQKREQTIQAAFLDLMRGRTLRTKTHLRNFQPIALAGVPIQLPAPVAPRGKQGSRTLGHLDVLARYGKGHLAVFELKQPRRGVGRGALRQAVQYAASLRWLMSRDQARPRYWAAFGSRWTTHVPRLHAYAVVSEEDSPDLLAEWRELELSNQAELALGVYVYSHRTGQLVASPLPR